LAEQANARRAGQLTAQFERFRAFPGEQGFNALIDLAFDFAHVQPARYSGR
jgi:hypothetical protein